MEPTMNGQAVSRRTWIRTGAALAGAACLSRFPSLAQGELAGRVRPADLTESLPSPDFHHPLDAQLVAMRGSSDPLVAKKYMILHDQALHHYESLQLTPTNDLRVLANTSEFVLMPGRTPAYFDEPFVKHPIKPIEHTSEFYDYSPDPDPKITAFWVDFANLQLGGGVFGHGFVQEEIMCCEVPELANASALVPPLRTRNPGKEVLAGSPTPLLLMGVHRVAEFYSSQKGHPYGTEDFRELDINRPQDYLKLLNPAVQFNVLAMAAPHLTDRSPQNQFGLDTIHDLFNTFTAGFTLAAAAAKATERYATVNTGKIGSGDFNNNASAVYVLQGLAAELLGVNLRFWGYADWEVELAGQYYGFIRRQIVPGTTTVAGVLKVAQRVLSGGVLADLSTQGDRLDGHLYGQTNTTYQIRTSTDLQHWSDAERVTINRVPASVSVPTPAGGAPVYIRADYRF